MSRFVIQNIINEEESLFDRQKRISWWDQKKLSQAKVMVVGSGAIGNETLKNLALLGIGNIFIVDFDTISPSNLSRTVLFRKEDEGKEKATIAAQKVKELCLNEKVNIDWFHGDAVWELGTGVFREMDLVLGCLDNIETRFAINRQCRLAEVPFIDAGIYELMGHVSVFSPSGSSCLECGASAEQIQAVRKRYSCDDFKRAALHEEKVPTVQISSAIISAIQVQEGIKLLCGQVAAVGKQIFWNGKIYDFALISLSRNPDCTAHASYPQITSLPLTRETSLKDFLAFISQEQYSGGNPTLDFCGERSFVVSIHCRTCKKNIEMYRPIFQIFDTEAVCLDCQKNKNSFIDTKSDVEVKKITLGRFNIEETEETILEMSLRELGIPFMHVVAVQDRKENYQYYEISGDRKLILPNFYAYTESNK